MKDFSFKFEGDFKFFGELFKGISFIKLKLISFFSARYLTVSLRGPVLTLRRGTERRVYFRGWVFSYFEMWARFDMSR